ncbi:GrpE, mitochondrial [Entomophthora muscae]|uniref:GrpE, mitochondrial n=1 Tax=Entomophthora muscae TaxID=34485 RepID=A0ACC2SH49_9FUNG|nr:GrpE, mitochondrial [Entomophthora muscae]
MLSTLRISRNAILRSVNRSSVFSIHSSSFRYEETKDKEAQPPKEEDFKKLLTEKDIQIAELKDHYLRSLADMENLRQRTKKEVENSSNFAIQKFAKDILSTVDVLGLALKSVTKEQLSSNKDLETFHTGVVMTETELTKTLKRHGLEQINPTGEVFDPNMHQALYQAPAPGKEHGSVLSVEKVGYTLKGRVIRPAQVGVVKNE